LTQVRQSWLTMSQTGRVSGQLVLSRQAAQAVLTQNGVGLLQSWSREQPAGLVSSPMSGGRGKPQAVASVSRSESAIQGASGRAGAPREK
jgi:hypothetical protein